MGKINKQSDAEPTSLLASLMKKMKHDASGGILLMVSTVLALIVSNLDLAWYPALLETPVKVMVGELVIHKPMLLWINDG